MIFICILITRDLLLLSDDSSYCVQIQYKSKRDRLLFVKHDDPQVIDLSTFVSGNEVERKIKLIADNLTSYGACCFAGSKNVLVVAVSRDLHIWSVSPEGRFNSSTSGGAVVEHFMLIPSKFNVSWNVRLGFSKERSASISNGYVSSMKIRVWTPSSAAKRRKWASLKTFCCTIPSLKKFLCQLSLITTMNTLMFLNHATPVDHYLFLSVCILDSYYYSIDSLTT